jgi:lipopolysaccharide/colanic/teichoic acid biosynthesis glycosyltransferase
MDRLTSEELLKKIRFLKKIKGTNDFNFSFQEEIPMMHRFLYKFDYVIRRILDILIALFVLCILSPIMLLISLLIKLESSGPVFYAAYRAGRAYRIFKFYKFRSMVCDADSRVGELKYKNQYADITDHGPIFFKVANDPRITRLGSFLRKTSLDELPQLLNVLKGDMSLVGNRPLPLYEAATLTSDSCVERFLAPAGITGLWQVQKRGNAKMSASERVGLDITYAHNHSFWYDIKIMCKTPFSMTQKEKV